MAGWRVFAFQYAQLIWVCCSLGEMFQLHVQKSLGIHSMILHSRWRRIVTYLSCPSRKIYAAQMPYRLFDSFMWGRSVCGVSVKCGGSVKTMGNRFDIMRYFSLWVSWRFLWRIKIQRYRETVRWFAAGFLLRARWHSIEQFVIIELQKVAHFAELFRQLDCL